MARDSVIEKRGKKRQQRYRLNEIIDPQNNLNKLNIKLIQGVDHVDIDNLFSRGFLMPVKRVEQLNKESSSSPQTRRPGYNAATCRTNRFSDFMVYASQPASLENSIASYGGRIDEPRMSINDEPSNFYRQTHGYLK